MSLVTTLVQKNISQEHVERIFKCVLTSTYPALGDILDFTAATDPKKLGRMRPPAKPLPTNDEISVIQAPVGFTAEVKQNGTSPTLANFLVRVFNIALAAECITGAYATGALGNAVYIRVRTKRRHG